MVEYECGCVIDVVAGVMKRGRRTGRSRATDSMLYTIIVLFTSSYLGHALAKCMYDDRYPVYMCMHMYTNFA